MPKTSLLVAVLDACVLYPPSLRDLFIRLASGLVFQPRWTEEIHDEWMRNVLADNPELTLGQLERTRRLMDQVTPHCLVFGYERRIAGLSLPDAGDRHVLAAAIEAGTALIVTFNLADFPVTLLHAYGIQPVHPDDFHCALFEDRLASAPDFPAASAQNSRRVSRSAESQRPEVARDAYRSIHGGDLTKGRWP